MAAPRCVVFDFDGVLVDSNATKRRAYFEIFADLDPTGELVRAAVATHGDGDRFQLIGAICERLVAAGQLPTHGATAATAADFATAYNEICEEFAATCAEIGGASAALEVLAPRCALYVNSATPQAPLRRIVARRGWEQHFRAVLGRPRSKVENLQDALEREGLAPHQAVMVGDGRHDIAAARTLGCRFVGVRNSFNDFDTAGLPMLDDLHGLPALLAELGWEE